MSLIPANEDSKERLKRLSAGAGLVYPLDEAYQVDRLPFKMTPTVALLIARECCESRCYEEAQQRLFKSDNIDFNDDGMQFVVKTIGKMVFLKDEERAEQIFNDWKCGRLCFSGRKTGHTLYLEVDGAMLNTIRINKDDSSWRENKLGLAFSSKDLVSVEAEDGSLDFHIGKREYVSYLGDVVGFKKHVLALAMRNGYGLHQRVVILADGAPWISKIKEELFPEALQILDFYHMCSHIAEFAKAIFKNNDNDATRKEWYQQVKMYIRTSKTKKAVSKIESTYKARCHKERNSLLAYIRKHNDHIDYGTYENEGLFTGSGAIESGNKTVLQRRMKQAGMRWNTESAQYVLSLMSKLNSGLWNKEVIDALYCEYGIENLEATEFVNRTWTVT
jgi:hypothetical protein